MSCYLSTMLLLLVLAILSTWRAQHLLLEYRKMETSDERRAASLERRWRICAHALWLGSLVPVPLYLTSEVARLTQLAQQIVGTAVLAGLVLVVLKAAADIKLRSLLIKELSVINEMALAALGVLCALLLAIVSVVWRQPELRKELLKTISGQ
jgi:hypothetical protein